MARGTDWSLCPRRGDPRGNADHQSCKVKQTGSVSMSDQSAWVDDVIGALGRSAMLRGGSRHEQLGWTASLKTWAGSTGHRRGRRRGQRGTQASLLPWQRVSYACDLSSPWYSNWINCLFVSPCGFDGRCFPRLLPVWDTVIHQCLSHPTVRVISKGMG